MSKAVESFKAAIEAANKLNEALKEYCLPGDSIPVNVDNLCRALKECYNVKVEIRKLRPKSGVLLGMIEIYEHKAVVRIAAGLSASLEKYVIIKEFAHIITTNADNATKDPVSNIEHMVSGILFPDNGDEPDEVFLAEEIAKIVAMEVLFPTVIRRKAKADIAEGRDSIFKLAEWLEIPEKLVETALSDRYEHAMRVLGVDPN